MESNSESLPDCSVVGTQCPCHSELVDASRLEGRQVLLSRVGTALANESDGGCHPRGTKEGTTLCPRGVPYGTFPKSGQTHHYCNTVAVSGLWGWGRARAAPDMIWVVPAAPGPSPYRLRTKQIFGGRYVTPLCRFSAPRYAAAQIFVARAARAKEKIEP